MATHGSLTKAGKVRGQTPKVEGNRRRPRWKWSPISTQILTEAFKKVGRLAHMSSVY